MTGLIWFVQIVHYPLFLLLPDDAAPAYAYQHQRRTGWVVAPLMLLELATSSIALNHNLRPAYVSFREALAGFALLVVIWLSTVLVQVPLHHQLSKGNNQRTILRLVQTNWLRTLAWSLRSALLIAALGRVGS